MTNGATKLPVHLCCLLWLCLVVLAVRVPLLLVRVLWSDWNPQGMPDWWLMDHEDDDDGCWLAFENAWRLPATTTKTTTASYSSSVRPSRSQLHNYYAMVMLSWLCKAWMWTTTTKPSRKPYKYNATGNFTQKTTLRGTFFFVNVTHSKRGLFLSLVFLWKLVIWPIVTCICE